MKQHRTELNLKRRDWNTFCSPHQCVVNEANKSVALNGVATKKEILETLAVGRTCTATRCLEKTQGLGATAKTLRLNG